MQTLDTAVIKTTGLTKSYRGTSVLHNLSLSVPRHSIFGFLGPNGAGKSTTGCPLGEAAAWTHAAHLRARGDLTELRATDVRFTPAEAAAFLNATMGLSLAPDTIAALEARTEGWVAGLQLAALSLQGHHDATSFMASFTSSHQFVLDYLVGEVVQQ